MMKTIVLCVLFVLSLASRGDCQPPPVDDCACHGLAVLDDNLQYCPALPGSIVHTFTCSATINEGCSSDNCVVSSGTVTFPYAGGNSWCYYWGLAPQTTGTTCPAPSGSMCDGSNTGCGSIGDSGGSLTCFPATQYWRLCVNIYCQGCNGIGSCTGSCPNPPSASYLRYKYMLQFECRCGA